MLDEWGIGTPAKSIDDEIQKEMDEAAQEKKASERNMFTVIATAAQRNFIPTEEEYDKISSYLFLRYFSNDPYGLMLVNDLNIRNNIPRKWEYWFMRILMPPSTRYIRYNKKEKFEDEELLEHLRHYYKCSENTAKEYYEMLPKDEIERIKGLYKVGNVTPSKKKGKNK